MKKYLLIALISTCLTAPPAKAGGIPVFDGVGLSQTILQLQQMAQDYQNQLEQLDQAVSTYNALSGARNMGDLLNSSLEQDLRRALPDDLQAMIGLDSASGLGTAGLQTQGIFNTLLSDYNPITGAELFASDPNSALAKAYDRHNKTTIAAMAASESAYNNTITRTQNYETLLTELSNSPDLKASIDLLARLTAENGMLMNEIMRLQSLDIQRNAAAQGQVITNTKRNDMARQYDPIIAAQSFEITP